MKKLSFSALLFVHFLFLAGNVYGLTASGYNSGWTAGYPSLTGNCQAGTYISPTSVTLGANCNPRSYTAAELQCLDAKFKQNTTTYGINYWGDSSDMVYNQQGACVYAGDLCPGTWKLSTMNYDCVALVVKDLNLISLTAASTTLSAVGQTQQLTVTATYSDASTADVTSNAVYSTDNASVVTVSTGGLITAVAAGTATITVTYTKNGVTQTNSVIMSVKWLDSITSLPASHSFANVNTTKALAITAHYSDGTTADVTAQATYSSNAPAYVSVSSGGVLTSVATGSATISVAYTEGTYSKSLNVPVDVQVFVTYLTTSVSTLYFTGLNQTQNITVTAHYSDGTTEDVTNQATYTSTNPSIATVDAAGTVTSTGWGVCQ